MVGGKITLNQDETNKVTVKSPDTEVSGEVILTLPATPGLSGQVLVTDGNGNLNWMTIAAGPTGSTGPAGSIGSTGVTGPTGPTGPTSPGSS